ncbi:MAG: anthranilate synthase component I family protein [Bacteroidota bacterium]
MKIFPLKTRYKKLLADAITPVSAYLRLRDHFANPILLESSDYHGDANPLSFICLEPMAEFKLANQEVHIQYPDGSQSVQSVSGQKDLPAMLQAFLNSFAPEQLDFKFSYNGLFGYQAYDTVRHYESVEIEGGSSAERVIPDLIYQAFRYVLVFDHFHNELYIFEHRHEDNVRAMGIDRIESLLNHQSLPRFTFSASGEESSNLTDEEFLNIIQTGKDHCQRGDVFQIVLSRRFQQGFEGDEFNVYRALRSINPSPYLFYCDYGNFKLMGSSPEAQLIIENEQATIHPIAGTFRRTGNDEEDLKLARKLFDDPKENAEHVMLVDLARNDLSRNGSEVKVDTYKEIQYFSHVIHLVSKVTAKIDTTVSSMQLVADTFPAGTLSGAPKHRAMQLIEANENGNRGYYGGCIGYLGFNGNFNQAIMIRSFLSKQNVLYYQAGAGVVSKSVPQSELQEVHNKLAALRNALELANTINR